MKDNIKDKIKEKEEKKTKPISITLSQKILGDLKTERKRLEVSRSFLIEMILVDYFNKPISKEDAS